MLAHFYLKPNQFANWCLFDHVLWMGEIFVYFGIDRLRDCLFTLQKVLDDKI